MENSKQKVMDATMEVVARTGLEGLNMRQVASLAGIKAGTIYNYFDSKDQLLYECFLLVNHQIAGLFRNCTIPVNAGIPEIAVFAHDCWVRYFKFMIGNGNRSLFYYAYRESANLPKILMRNNETVAGDMADFSALLRNVLQKFGKSEDIFEDFFWLFVLEGTGNFVKRIIRDERAVSDEDVEHVWKLLTRGVFGSFLP